MVARTRRSTSRGDEAPPMKSGLRKMIYVSAQDIQYGCRGSNRFDPIGNALHRQGFLDPTVTKKSVHLRDGREFELPDEARIRIDAWGDGKNIAPFWFEL